MGSSALASAASVNLLPRLLRPSPPSNHIPPIPILIPLSPSRSVLKSTTIQLALTTAAPNPGRFHLRRRFAAAMDSIASSDASTKRNRKLLVFETEEELSVSLAKYTAELSERFSRERGAFTVVLSGGSLIKSLRKLVEIPYFGTVDWAKWHVFWVDERVVPKDHPDSNYKLAYDGLLSKVPIPPDQIYAINDSLSAEGAADEYETNLKHLVKTGVVELSKKTGLPKFDLMLLGMGPDGHVASLFPGHPLLNENQRWVAFIKESPKPPPERITFTFPVINSSAYIALVATGAGKASAVHQALGGESSSTESLPVQMVTLEEGEFTWFTDNTAVSMLQDKASL